MNFECDSCHAKYKISDEKVRGRVVRFPCRKCEHKILIDGRGVDPDVTVPAAAAYGFDDVTRPSEPASTFGHEAPTARARRTSSPVRRRPPSVPPRRPSAVSRRLSSSPAAASTALVGQHPGLTPPLPSTALSPKPDSDVAEWHVSINDVPVGPIRLDEMAHKIDAGAVSEYALVWRDGFDEWRPLATVPELMALLHERRFSGPPARPSFSSMPPFVDSRSSVSESSRASARSSRPSAARDLHENVPIEFAPLADALQPTEDSSEIFEPSASLGPADTAEPQRRISLGGLALIVAVAVFSAVVAFLVFDRFGDSLIESVLGEARPAAVPPSAPARSKAPAVEELERAAEQTVIEAAAAAEDGTQSAAPGDVQAPAEGEAPAGDGSEDTTAALLVKPPDPRDEAPQMRPIEPRASKVRPDRRPEPKEASPEGDSLNAADQKILDEFGSSAHAAPAKIDIGKKVGVQSDSPPLDGDAVRATVTTNKPRLQRCYERAIRGQQSPPSVRLDVTVMVTASGRVKSVSAEGSAPGGLAECVEASVRRWRFPQSSEGGPAMFPIVFSSN